jgi:hypothetical protein
MGGCFTHTQVQVVWMVECGSFANGPLCLYTESHVFGDSPYWHYVRRVIHSWYPPYAFHSDHWNSISQVSYTVKSRDTGWSIAFPTCKRRSSFLFTDKWMTHAPSANHRCLGVWCPCGMLLVGVWTMMYWHLVKTGCNQVLRVSEGGRGSASAGARDWAHPSTKRRQHVHRS